MIGKLTGAIDSIGEDWALVDVAGVGYLVFASGRTLAALPGTGQPASVLVETHVREDHIHLYGFSDAAERDWFRLLCTVQGVGAKMALSILSALGPDDLVRSIAAQDKTTLTRANGVGPKLAGRIVTELKDKTAHLALAVAVLPQGLAAGPPAGAVSEDAVSALVNLGYRRVEAFGAVARAMGELGKGAPVENLVKVGLKELAS